MKNEIILSFIITEFEDITPVDITSYLNIEPTKVIGEWAPKYYRWLENVLFSKAEVL